MSKSLWKTKAEMKSTGFYNTYYGKNSLIWYRGNFFDDLKDEEIVEILDDINTNHIIVGHCSNEEVVQLYDGKI